MIADRSVIPLLLVVLSLSLPATFAPPPATAAHVELTPMASYRTGDYRLRRDLPCLAIYQECTLRADGGDDPAFGLLLGVGLAPGWQLEVLANRQESEVEASTRLIAPPGSAIPSLQLTEDLDFEATHLHVGVSRAWGEDSVQPFVSAALGASRIEIAAVQGVRTVGFSGGNFPFEEVSEDVLSASAAAGVKIHLTPGIGVRLEARGYWVDLPHDAGGSFTQAETAAGLILRF